MLVLKCPYCGNENVEINKELTVGNVSTVIPPF